MQIIQTEIPKRKRRSPTAMAEIRDAIVDVVEGSESAQTVRQVYYQLVARHVIDNSRSEYQLVSRLLVDMRLDAQVDWEAIEDRLRRARHVTAYSDLGDFAKKLPSYYRRDVWQDQPMLVELWLEKDALSGIFDECRWHYGVTLNVGRGFDGWDSIHNAAARYDRACKPVKILYFGDFDPSGEDMVRSLRDRLLELDQAPEIVKCALNADDIERYSLPPDVTKTTDSRRAAFVAKHGDISVELDALPIDVLSKRIITEIEARMDLDRLDETKAAEKEDMERLVKIVTEVGS